MAKTFTHSPVKQTITIISLLVIFWGGYFYLHQHEEQVEQVQQYEQPVQERLQERMEHPDTVESKVPTPVPEVIEEITTYDWLDMILGHLSSLLTSLVTLFVPVWTYYKNKKEKDE